jgi:hypothetical protein
MDVVELIKLIGFPAVLAGYFVIQGTKREKAQNIRFESLETFCRDELLSVSKKGVAINEKCSKALDKSADALKENTEVLKEITPMVKDYLAGRS